MQEVRKSQNQYLRADPAWSKLREDGIQTRRLSWPQAPEGGQQAPLKGQRQAYCVPHVLGSSIGPSIINVYKPLSIINICKKRLQRQTNISDSSRQFESYDQN